jgi:hypothetical protein
MQASARADLTSPAARRALAIIRALRCRLDQPAFLARHRCGPKAFTRLRTLPFALVVLCILQKSVKSLQLHLHEFLDQWHDDAPERYASPGAFTRARAKLQPSAYVELNAEGLRPMVYRDAGGEGLRRWRGHRMLGIDSSLIRLPNTAGLAKAFGLGECGNHKGKSTVRYPEARISVLYDVLNHYGWDARLEPHLVAETQLARDHLARARAGDLILCDRGYAGLFWLVFLRSLGMEFVVRCGQGSFGPVQKLFKRNEAGVSWEVVLESRNEVKRELRRAALPTELRVRLITVRLDTGELEVLATSLLDTTRYPTAEFAQVHHWRWGIETYYGRLKGRLELENWSGKTKEAIEQDFQAAVFLSNLETVVCRSAEQELAQATAHRAQAVQLNQAVCLHTIKNRIIELLTGRQPAQKVLARLLPLFQANPVCVRRQRKVARRKIPPGQAYHFQRNVRKIVF